MVNIVQNELSLNSYHHHNLEKFSITLELILYIQIN
jgi:hypothetical protein